MQLYTFTAPQDFLTATQTELEKQEVLNSLILGIPRLLINGPGYSDDPPYFAAVMENGELLAAAFMTPPHGLCLTTGPRGTDKALRLIAENLHSNGWSLPEVIGPNPFNLAFARIWAQLTGQQYKLSTPQFIYELRAVTPPEQQASGSLRLADPNEGDLLAEWLLGFDQDAFGRQTRTVEAAFDFIDNRIQAGDIYVWQDGAPVSMLMGSRPTSHGITINMVYTPPELRGRGYASASVAALSQMLLDKGYEFCTLFTDADNSTSNKIYRQVGYELVGAYDKFSFE